MNGKEITIEDTQFYDKITKMETTIIDRLTDLRKISRNCPCSHLMELPHICQSYAPTHNYFNKFWQLYLKMELGNIKHSIMAEEVEEMENGIRQVEQMFERLEEIKSENGKFKRKTRRRADEISRNYVCPARNCFKSYGTELALKVHIKKKHPSPLNSAQSPHSQF